MIAEGIHALIIADSAVCADLTTYQFGTGAETPAVFTTDVIPEDAALPAVIINECGGPAWGTRGRKGADVLTRVRVYGNKTRDTSALRDLAWRIWRLINRSVITPSDADFVSCRTIADPPLLVPDPDGFPGYSIDVRAIVLED